MNLPRTFLQTSQLLVAKSLSEATRAGKRLRELILSSSEDLRCVNLMCEKVGEPCICRLARTLSQTPALERLVLSNNNLTVLPEEVFKLQSLRYLDLSNNLLRELPPSVLQLSSLEVLSVDENLLADSSTGNIVVDDSKKQVRQFIRERTAVPSCKTTK